MVKRLLVSIVFLVAGMSIASAASYDVDRTLSVSDLERSTIAVTVAGDYLDALIVEPKPPVSEPPIDWASRAYDVANQVGQSWRAAADAYRHIDPGRRSA